MFTVGLAFFWPHIANIMVVLDRGNHPRVCLYSNVEIFKVSNTICILDMNYLYSTCKLHLIILAFLSMNVLSKTAVTDSFYLQHGAVELLLVIKLAETWKSNFLGSYQRLCKSPSWSYCMLAYSAGSPLWGCGSDSTFLSGVCRLGYFSPFPFFLSNFTTCLCSGISD